jgi:hypothetical protein
MLGVMRRPISHHHHLYSPLLDIGLFNISSSRSIFGYSHPALANRPEEIFIPHGLIASFTTFTETRSPFQHSFTSTVVGTTADMANPLPHQRANTVCSVGDVSDQTRPVLILIRRGAFHITLCYPLRDKTWLVCMYVCCALCQAVKVKRTRRNKPPFAL